MRAALARDYIDARGGTLRRRATAANSGNNNGSGDKPSQSITICEGTGHAGVGSVVGAGNARVAAELGADVVLVANGGLGRAFDELDVGGNPIAFSENGRQLYTSRDGELRIVSWPAGDERTVSTSAQVVDDFERTKVAAFEQGWGEMRDGFYDPPAHFSLHL